MDAIDDELPMIRGTNRMLFLIVLYKSKMSQTNRSQLSERMAYFTNMKWTE